MLWLQVLLILAVVFPVSVLVHKIFSKRGNIGYHDCTVRTRSGASVSNVRIELIHLANTVIILKQRYKKRPVEIKNRGSNVTQLSCL